MQCEAEHPRGKTARLLYSDTSGRARAAACAQKQRVGMRPARGRSNGLSFSNVDSFLVHSAPAVRVEVRTSMLRILGARQRSCGFRQARR